MVHHLNFCVNLFLVVLSLGPRPKNQLALVPADVKLTGKSKFPHHLYFSILNLKFLENSTQKLIFLGKLKTKVNVL